MISQRQKYFKNNLQSQHDKRMIGNSAYLCVRRDCLIKILDKLKSFVYTEWENVLNYFISQVKKTCDTQSK